MHLTSLYSFVHSFLHSFSLCFAGSLYRAVLCNGCAVSTRLHGPQAAWLSLRWSGWLNPHLCQCARYCSGIHHQTHHTAPCIHEILHTRMHTHTLSLYLLQYSCFSLAVAKVFSSLLSSMTSLTSYRITSHH